MKFVILLLTLLTIYVDSHAQVLKTIPFVWTNDTMNGTIIEKTAILIPIQFENDTSTYFFQFDTGANSSCLYTRNLQDSMFIQRITSPTGISTSLGMLKFESNENMDFQADKDAPIGTIGSDFLSERILEIDFKNGQLVFIVNYDETNYWISDIDQSFGRPVFRLSYDNKEYLFLFDTGSSLFELWTSKSVWRKWRHQNSEWRTFEISSWGKTKTAVTSSTHSDSPNFLHIQFKEISYVENYRFKRTMLNGIIGNKPFLNEILLLDFQKNKVGLKKLNE